MLTNYFILHYDRDIHYCKDHMHYAKVWQQMYDGWGELPNNIERVDCTTEEFNEVFGIKKSHPDIIAESMKGMVAEE